MSGTNRKLREVPWLAGGPDPRLVRLNNASYIIDEFTSPRRVATLARIPTQAEVLDAIDTQRSLATRHDGATVAVLDQLRPLVQAWTPCVEVPVEIQQLVRQLTTVVGGLEPPAGWDAYDGHWQTWGTQTAAGTATVPEISPEAQVDADRVMKMAAAVSDGMNIAALLASPRVWAKASPRPSREHLLRHLDEYVAAIAQSGWTAQQGQSPPRAATAAAQQLRLLCESWEPGPELPPEVLSAARAVLAACGLPEPPGGGWDAFEGLPDSLAESR